MAMKEAPGWKPESALVDSAHQVSRQPNREDENDQPETQLDQHGAPAPPPTGDRVLLARGHKREGHGFHYRVGRAASHGVNR